MGPTDRRITFKWEKFEITGYKKLRDPWRQKELGKISESYTSEIFSHGVTLLVLKP